MNGEQRPGSYFAHAQDDLNARAQDDLNLRIFRMSEGTVSLDVAHMAESVEQGST